MQAIKIDYFDVTGDNQEQETNGKLYARNCIFDLTLHKIPVLRAIEILRSDVNNANWVGNIKSNFYFGTGFLNELYLIEQQIKEDEESQLIESFREKLKRCYAKKAVPHPKDASIGLRSNKATVPPRFRKKD
jgi:hypothetical protein